MNTDDRIMALEEAREKIYEAIESIEQAVRGTSTEASADAYIVSHLRNWADGENPHDSTAIPRLIEDMKEEDEEGEW